MFDTNQDKAEVMRLNAENEKLWNANKQLAQSFQRLTAEIKRLKRNADTLKQTVDMWQRAEKVAFAEIDEVLNKIENLNNFGVISHE